MRQRVEGSFRPCAPRRPHLGKSGGKGMGITMKILWLCNTMLPVVAEHLHREATNKEGWLSGLCDVILKRQRDNGITLALAFPVDEQHLAGSDKVKNGIYQEDIEVQGVALHCYGFYENTAAPHEYHSGLEKSMERICEDFRPEVIHCFGTEYPHTLALCRAYPHRERILISIQGLCAVYANAYLANLPEDVVKTVTFRDRIKGDSILQQQEKFRKRGEHEIEAIRLAGNVSGRTAWDRHYTREWNPNAHYYAMNETLRSNFYEGQWEKEKCLPYSIFLSQGDYPIKGLHYMLLALPLIQKQYPRARVYVAGNSVVKYHTLQERIKISAYGKYLRSIIRHQGIEEAVVFLGPMNAQQMKEQYLRSNLFLCCSAIENSPNSLGEAMLLGMPCISAKMGGVESIFTDGEDGIIYPGFKSPENSFDNICDSKSAQEGSLENNVKYLADAVIRMWSNEEKMLWYCQNARNHAQKTHNREANYHRMTEIYAKIVGE